MLHKFYKSCVLSPLPHIIPYIIFILGILLLNIFLTTGGEGHLGYLSKISYKTIFGNIIYYIFGLSGFFDLNLRKILGLAILIFFAPLIFIGTKRFLSQYYGLGMFILIFILSNLALLILWPFVQGIRFTFCLYPFVVFFMAIGGKALFQEYVGYKFYKKSIFYIVIGIFIFFIFKTGWHAYRVHSSPYYKEHEAFSNDALEIYDFIKTNTLQDDKIIFFKPRVLYLNTHRLSVATPKQDEIPEYDYLLSYEYSGGWVESAVKPYIENNSSLDLILIFKNENFALYKIAK